MSSDLEIPSLVDASDIESWSDDVDVVVIGFGMAGGCAAVAAAAAGATVLVLERAATVSGTTALAGGHFYLGGGTPVQEATDHPDSPDAMYDFLVAVSSDPDHEKIRIYCDGSVEHFHWLEGLGFEFERSYFADKAVIQPRTEGLLYTGNEKVWPFRTAAKPAPRGHKVPVPGDTGGASMVVFDGRPLNIGTARPCRSASILIRLRKQSCFMWKAVACPVSPPPSTSRLCWLPRQRITKGN